MAAVSANDGSEPPQMTGNTLQEDASAYNGKVTNRVIVVKTLTTLVIVIAALALLIWYYVPPATVGLGSMCPHPPQEALLYGAANNYKTADHICCHNTHFAESFGYFKTVSFFEQLDPNKRHVFYDSACGIPLYVAPIGRTFKEWEEESEHHGWPSFRDEEIIMKNHEIRYGGEVRSTCGTHLGHNLPDGRTRFCINLVCMAGSPTTKDHKAFNGDLFDADVENNFSKASDGVGSYIPWVALGVIGGMVLLCSLLWPIPCKRLCWK